MPFDFSRNDCQTWLPGSEMGCQIVSAYLNLGRELGLYAFEADCDACVSYQDSRSGWEHPLRLIYLLIWARSIDRPLTETVFVPVLCVRSVRLVCMRCCRMASISWDRVFLQTPQALSLLLKVRRLLPVSSVQYREFI